MPNYQIKQSIVNGKLLNCKCLSFVQRVEFPDIKDLKVVLDEAYDVGAVTDGEVEVDDGETVWEAVHERKEAGREAVDARERESVEVMGDG